MTSVNALGALAVSAALLAACGNEEEARPTAAKAPKLASAAVIDEDPSAIACGHVRDQQTWASVTRRATVAISNREKVPGINQLQATQSVFFAMTELCEGRPASHEPAQAAVRAVRAGKYRADLRAP
jgi:uncharacterized lipoprotein YajG